MVSAAILTTLITLETAGILKHDLISSVVISTTIGVIAISFLLRDHLDIISTKTTTKPRGFNRPRKGKGLGCHSTTGQHGFHGHVVSSNAVFGNNSSLQQLHSTKSERTGLGVSTFCCSVSYKPDYLLLSATYVQNEFKSGCQKNIFKGFPTEC